MGVLVRAHRSRSRSRVSTRFLSATRGSPLNSTAQQTQRRLMVALIVTLACLPLLVLDAVSASSSQPTSQAAAPEPSLVVANSPSTELPTSTTPSSVVVAIAPTTTTTTAPATTTSTAPPVVWVPPTTAAPAPRVVAPSMSDEEFMACVRWRESRNDYTAVDPSGQFMGAYQIYQGGWDDIAARLGRTDLVGVPPHTASPADQDLVAWKMLEVHGRRPWGGYCG